jgi:hypothetical protein
MKKLLVTIYAIALCSCSSGNERLVSGNERLVITIQKIPGYNYENVVSEIEIDSFHIDSSSNVHFFGKEGTGIVPLNYCYIRKD